MSSGESRRRLTLQTSMLEEMKHFYGNVLQFPLTEEGADSITMAVGSTLLMQYRDSGKRVGRTDGAVSNLGKKSIQR